MRTTVRDVYCIFMPFDSSLCPRCGLLEADTSEIDRMLDSIEAHARASQDSRLVTPRALLAMETLRRAGASLGRKLRALDDLHEWVIGSPMPQTEPLRTSLDRVAAELRSRPPEV